MTTQMLVTPKLHERLQLALEAITNIFGYKQAAIAIINERDAALRMRAFRALTRNNHQRELKCRSIRVRPVFALSMMLILSGSH